RDRERAQRRGLLRTDVARRRAAEGVGAEAPGRLTAGDERRSAKALPVSDIPDGIVLKRHRDLAARGHDPWIRRLLVGLVAVLCVVALANVFGQRPATSRAATAAAIVSVYSPDRVRCGRMSSAR